MTCRLRATLVGLATGVCLSLTALMPCGASDGADRSKTMGLVEAYNASGQELFKQFGAPRGNVIFSPYSIGTVMAMALAGARGETEAEMARILRHQLPRPEIDGANANLLAILKSYERGLIPLSCPLGMSANGKHCQSKPTDGGACPIGARREAALCVSAPTEFTPSAKLISANALVLANRGELVAKTYASRLASKYSAEIFRGTDVEKVNSWVKRKTEGKIEAILDRLDPRTVAVLLNAVYFKARWAKPFPKHATRNDDFRTTDGQAINVPMMHSTEYYSVLVGRGYRAIRLPYDVELLAMFIVVPDNTASLDRVSGSLRARELFELFAAVRTEPPKYVALAMPRFKSAFRVDDIAAIFKRAGMSRAFDLGMADFSGLTGRPALEVPFKIDQIVHRAAIEVMEDGTEAAAATAATTVVVSAPLRPKPVPFRVDRPFLFYVVDQTTDAILFQGRIVNP